MPVDLNAGRKKSEERPASCLKSMLADSDWRDEDFDPAHLRFGGNYCVVYTCRQLVAGHDRQSTLAPAWLLIRADRLPRLVACKVRQIYPYPDQQS